MTTPSQQHGTVEVPAPALAPTPVACLSCRDKHLKCDGATAGCSRCLASNIPCCYLPSRRGRKRSLSTSQPLFDCSETPDSFVSPVLMDMSSQPEHMITPLIDGNEFTFSPFPTLTSNLAGPLYQLDGSRASCFSSQQRSHTAVTPGGDHLAGLYYSHFHPSHPFLLPREAFFVSNPPRYLVDIINLISLHYISANLVNMDHINQLRSTIREAELSLEKTQALLLLSIVMHAQVLPQAAKECLGQAIDCGQQLGLDHPAASDAEIVRNPLRAESLRRTWWELFVIDTLLAAIQVDGALQIKSQEIPDVPLPCKRYGYQDGSVRLGGTTTNARELEQSQHLLFSEEMDVSSDGYRVETAIILRKCLLASPSESADALDATTAAWFHRLPSHKRAILNCDAEVDRMMFQAFMLLHCASIYLHFPRSRLLAFLPATSHLFCSSPPTALSVSSSSQLHTGKVLNAAQDLSRLASLSTLVANHSPFFCCALVLSSTIQLAVRYAKLQEPCATDLQLLGLNLNVLKSMGEIWRIAAVSKSRLRDIVMEVQNVVSINPHMLVRKT